MTLTELPSPEDIFTSPGVDVGSCLVVTMVDTVVGTLLVMVL